MDPLADQGLIPLVVSHSNMRRTVCNSEAAAFVNLPGWCWAEIQQRALVGSSSSLHSEACNALGASDGVIHSSISHEVDGLRASANIVLKCESISNDGTGRPHHREENASVQTHRHASMC